MQLKPMDSTGSRRLRPRCVEMHNAAGFLHRILEFAKSRDRQALATKELPAIVSSEAIWHNLFFLIVLGRP
jgi:hypothetical protein